MQAIEITAKSVQEATKAAAEKLGTSPENLKVTVLEETKGLFGKSTVRIRAEAPAAAAEAPVAEAAPAKARGSRAKAPVAAPEPAPVVEAAPAEEAAPKGRSRSRGRKPEAGDAPAEAPVAAASEEAEAVEAVATDQDADQLAELLREILATADLEITVKPTGLAGRYVNLEIDGKDVAFLVGKHGEVLNAMQYLLNIIAGRRFNNGIRATLDGNDYRKRREETLTQLASNIADQVKKRGEEAVLDALPAFERRIVHKALSVIEGITTYSEGEEPNRRVVIAPAD